MDATNRSLPESALTTLHTRATFALRDAPLAGPAAVLWGDSGDALAVIALIEEVRTLRQFAGTVRNFAACLARAEGDLKALRHWLQ
jgi:hypothetical protein